MNMTVNLAANEYLRNLALDVLGLSQDDDFIANDIFDQVEMLMRDPSYKLDEALSYLNDHYTESFDFFSALEKYDTQLITSDYTPRWALEEDAFDVVPAEHLDELGTEAFLRLVKEDDFIKSLFYYQILCTAFLGGMGDELIYDEIDHSEFLPPYKTLRPKAVAYILQQDYQGGTIKSVPEGVEPIDITNIPGYLLEDNPQIIMKDNKVYLKIDVEKAITAAGGLAQTMERQDLEGKTTNGAKKSNEDTEHQSTKQRDRKETDEDEETSGTTSLNRL